MQQLINLFGQIIVPAFVLFILVGAVIKRVNGYNAFVDGAADGLKTVARVFPYLAAMLIAINVFRESGLMQAIINMLAPVMNLAGVSPKLIPMMIVRPLSGSGALALLSDIMKEEGVDSQIATTAAVMMGSTETIFYTLSVYCGAAKIKNSGYALPVALISGTVGMIAAVLLCK